MRALLIILASLLGAAQLTESKDWSAELQAVAEKCGIPEQHLKWVDGSVRWLKPEESTYEQATCVFAELKARGVPMKQGFVASSPRDH